MTDQEDNINLGKFVFDDNNQERNSWACLGQTRWRSLIVFLSQQFVILLIIFGSFWRIHFSKTSDESTFTFWVGIFCSAAGYKLPSLRLWTNYFLQKKLSCYFIGWSFRNWKIGAYLHLAKNWNVSTKVWQNLLFLSTFPTSLRCYAKRYSKFRVCAWSNLWIYWFVKKQRHKGLVNFWQLRWRNLQSKGLCRHCQRWETSRCEHNLY